MTSIQLLKERLGPRNIFLDDLFDNCLCDIALTLDLKGVVHGSINL